jgi:hypothetical protein
MQDSLLADTPDEVDTVDRRTMVQLVTARPKIMCVQLTLEFQHLLRTGAIHCGQSLQLVLYPETLRYTIRTRKNDNFSPSTQKICAECTDFWPYAKRHTSNDKDRVRVP